MWHCHSARASMPQVQQTAPSHEQSSKWQQLSLTTYRSGNGMHHLILWEKGLPELSQLSKSTMDAYFEAHPNAGSTPNTMFSLTDSTGTGTPKLVWVQYVFHDKAIFPRQHWFANVVWPAGEANPYVALTMSIATHLETSLYRVLLTSDLGTLAEEPDFAHFNEWPVPPKPISKLKLDRLVPHLADGVDGISNLTATPTGNIIQLRGEREDKHSPPVYITFSLKTGAWQKGLRPDAMHALGKMDKQE